MAEQSTKSYAVKSGVVTGQIVERRTLIVAAWVSTLLLSKLPLVIARDILGSDVPWITTGWIVTAILLAAATFVWTGLKPLRVYFIIMGVIILAPVVLRPLITQSSVWKSLFEQKTELMAIFGDRLLLILDTIAVLAALFLLGVKRRQAFMTAGDLKAPAGGRISWAALGPIMALLLGGLFALFMITQNPAMLSNLSAALPWLPLILLSAALNAFGEEAQFRAAPLAALLPAVGPAHALWMTSLWFGLGHYYGGIPSGPVGLVFSGLLGALLGKAMLDTRGLGWSWFIHLVMDTVIYSSIAISAAGM